MPLDTKLVADLEAEAEEANAGRYRLHHWTDRCPDQWLEAVAALENQAGEDGVPGPEAEEMVFDGGILREAEEVTIAQGRRTVVTAVEHIASGTLVGLTTISVLALRPDVVFQDDTVVLQEHRGNKLGLLIKVANMERLSEQFPDARVLYTWNAPENRYLLKVNQQLGFTTAGVTGIWQKELRTSARLSAEVWSRGQALPAGARFGAHAPCPVSWEDQRPSVVGNPLSQARLTSAVAPGEPVDFRTKDPEHRAAGAGERSKAPRSWTASRQAPCICAGRF